MYKAICVAFFILFSTAASADHILDAQHCAGENGCAYHNEPWGEQPNPRMDPPNSEVNINLEIGETIEISLDSDYSTSTFGSQVCGFGYQLHYDETMGTIGPEIRSEYHTNATDESCVYDPDPQGGTIATCTISAPDDVVDDSNQRPEAYVTYHAIMGGPTQILAGEAIIYYGSNCDQVYYEQAHNDLASDTSGDDDSDGWADATEDNCPDVSNPGQENMPNSDFILAAGDRCDTDYNNDGMSNGADFLTFRACYVMGDVCSQTDHNGDGLTNGADFLRFRGCFGKSDQCL